jgi:tRNA modification GTPase
MNLLSHDIICAAATPPGQAALAIIRVSGFGSVNLVSKMMPALERTGQDDANRLIYGFINDTQGSPLDEVTAIPYFATKSYTAEEMVEIICHGGYASSSAILKRLAGLGARLAQPGEFTRRAFLNGRISLSEAEAVAAAIEAKSELALRAAARNLKGELCDKISDIGNTIRDLLSLIEAEIDFSDEEIDKTSFDKIKDEMARQIEKSEKILKGYDFGRGLNSGYRIAIVGKANVGKSSLLNALLNRDRAIVTDIPGTTRDTLTEWIERDGFPILLTDTAGLRQSEDTIETLGQERTRNEIDQSDIVLFMFDLSSDLTADDKAIFDSLEDKTKIVVANKIDKVSDRNIDFHIYFPNETIIPISAKTSEGLESLKSQISQLLNLDSFSLDTALLATERQYQAMKLAYETLIQARQEIETNHSAEIISIFLREALDHLGELIGETTTEDIINNIFSRFCIGK